MDKKKFMGFYTSPPFWAIEAVDLNDSNNYNKRMSEQVVKVENNIFIIQVARDGQIEIQIKDLEEQVSSYLKSRTDELDFEGESKYWSLYLNYINTFYLLLDSKLSEIQKIGHFHFEELTAKNIFRIMYNNDNTLICSSTPHNDITSTYSLARYLNIQGFNPSDNLHFSHIFSTRQVITQETFLSTIEIYKEICKEKDLVEDLAQVSKSLSELKNGNCELSLVVSWFISEKIINFLCRSKLKQSSIDVSLTFMKSKFTQISKKIDFLDLVNVVDDGLYQSLKKTNTIRNNIVHQNEKDDVSQEDALLSLHIVEQLILLKYNFSTTINYSLSLASIK